MEQIHWNTGGAAFINTAAIVVWACIVAISLYLLYKRRLSQVATALWIIIIVFCPVIGGLAFMIVGKRATARGR
jgi:ABC-type molybdate transport system permease subunit